MSIQRQVCRVLSILGLMLFAASPATAQVSEPEFVPYVNDLQLFDQPDLSGYGRGVAPPQGWFGSAEFVNWSIQAPPKTLMGSIPTQAVYIPGAMTINTGTAASITITNVPTVSVLTTTSVTTTPGTTVTVTGSVTVTLTTTPLTTTVVTGTSTVTTPSSITVTTTQGLPTIQLIPTQITTPFVGSDPNITQGAFRNRGAVSSAGTQFSQDTGTMSSDFTTGGRFEFGRMVEGRGWMVSSLNLGTQTLDLERTNVSINFENQPVGFVDIRGPNTAIPTAVQNPGTGLIGYNNLNFAGDGYDDDLDGDGIYGRHGRDRGTRNGAAFSAPLDGIPDPESPAVAPQQPIIVTPDYDDAVPLPTVFQYLKTENRTSMYGVETMRLWGLGQGPRGGGWELFGGMRFLSIRDEFLVDGRGPNSNPQYFLNPLDDSYWNTSVQNNLLGGQFGGRWSLQRERWGVSVETRFITAANFQNAKQQGQFASRYMRTAPETNQITAGAFTTPLRDDIVNGQVPHAFNNSRDDVLFSPGGELRFNLRYQVFRSMTLQAGYTAMFLANVGRGSVMTRYSFPNMGILQENNDSNFFANGVNFGVVINR